MLQFSHFDLLFPNDVAIMLEIFIIILTKKWTIQNTDKKISRVNDRVLHATGLSITKKLFVKSENSRSAATENCKMINTIFQAPDQYGIGPFRISSTSQACLRCLKHLQNLPHTWEARIFYLLCQHNSQMLPIMLKIMPAYFAKPY